MYVGTSPLHVDSVATGAGNSICDVIDGIFTVDDRCLQDCVVRTRPPYSYSQWSLSTYGTDLKKIRGLYVAVVQSWSKSVAFIMGSFFYISDSSMERIEQHLHSRYRVIIIRDGIITDKGLIILVQAYGSFTDFSAARVTCVWSLTCVCVWSERLFH